MSDESPEVATDPSAPLTTADRMKKFLGLKRKVSTLEGQKAKLDAKLVAVKSEIAAEAAILAENN